MHGMDCPASTMTISCLVSRFWSSISYLTFISVREWTNLGEILLTLICVNLLSIELWILAYYLALDFARRINLISDLFERGPLVVLVLGQVCYIALICGSKYKESVHNCVFILDHLNEILALIIISSSISLHIGPSWPHLRNGLSQMAITVHGGRCLSWLWGRFIALSVCCGHISQLLQQLHRLLKLLLLLRCYLW